MGQQWIFSAFFPFCALLIFLQQPPSSSSSSRPSFNSPSHPITHSPIQLITLKPYLSPCQLISNPLYYSLGGFRPTTTTKSTSSSPPPQIQHPHQTHTNPPHHPITIAHQHHSLYSKSQPSAPNRYPSIAVNN